MHNYVDTDPVLVDILNIISSENDLQEMWFNFGTNLGLTITQLHEIELTCNEPLHCTRVLLHWRVNNSTASWQPIADALVKIGLSDLAHKVHDHFTLPSATAVEPLDKSAPNGVLCDQYHLVDHSINDVPSKY